MYALACFVPTTHTQAVLDAAFAAGAGRAGNYERCAFVCGGTGRYRPLAGSNPFIGTEGKDEFVAEDRIEFISDDDKVDDVVEALRSAHPYEEPAIYLYRLDERCV